MRPTGRAYAGAGTIARVDRARSRRHWEMVLVNYGSWRYKLPSFSASQRGPGDSSAVNRLAGRAPKAECRGIAVWLVCQRGSACWLGWLAMSAGGLERVGYRSTRVDDSVDSKPYGVTMSTGPNGLVAELPKSRITEGSCEVSMWSRVKFGVVRAFLWGWAVCFSLKGLYLLGRFFGTCEWLLGRRRRLRFRLRLQRTYHDELTRKFVRQATRRHFMRVRCDKFFYLIFDKLPRDKILKRIKFHGKEILDSAVAQGRGVYVTLSHHGSHHVLGLLMALMGYKVAGVRDRQEGALRKYVQDRYAETFPEFRAIRLLFADSFPRDIYRAFHEGYILGSALDVDRHRGEHLRTAKVRILGREREFLTGTMHIALRCRAPILQGFVVSRKSFYFRLIVLPALVDPKTAVDSPEVVADAMQRYAGNIEAHVRAHPCHVSKW